MDSVDVYKKQAAEAAVAEVQNGMTVGLGTGSTAAFAVSALAARFKSGNVKDIVCVSTSDKTTHQAKGLGLPLTDLQAKPKIDLAIDGADEIHLASFFLIKGLGGALLREKQVESVAKRFIVVVDDSKVVQKLGEKCPVPVEVRATDWQTVQGEIAGLGATPALRKNGTEPFITDNGNYILDCRFVAGIAAPKSIAKFLERIKGVLAHGLFLDMATDAFIANGVGVHKHVAAPK